MSSETASHPTEVIQGFETEAFEAFLATRSEPDWVTESRRAAFDLFLEKQAEPLDPEEWKRIDLRIFRPSKYTVNCNSESSSNLSTLLEDRTSFAGLVTHSDGKCTRFELSDELAQQGVLFGNLADLVNEHREILEPHIGRYRDRGDLQRRHRSLDRNPR